MWRSRHGVRVPVYQRAIALIGDRLTKEYGKSGGALSPGLRSRHAGEGPGGIAFRSIGAAGMFAMAKADMSLCAANVRLSDPKQA